MSENTQQSPIQWLSYRDAFASPVFVGRIGVAEQLNPVLLQEIYAYKAASAGMNRSNQNGWHSDTDLFKRTEPALANLCKHIVLALTAATRKVAPELDIEEATWNADGWINVSHQRAFNTVHDHAGFMWSGVYYVQVPQTSQGRSGQIEFLDPRGSIMASALRSDYFAPKLRMKPQAGQLILFPSYLSHWVYPNEEEEDRISIAFNASLVGAKPKAKPAQ